ncbi:DUF418 domain-containing protein [Qipengyuania marisflavi]|uniref:DUF418 domain-containing protein n=2 Tax=Qipengyuania marisflavi TaxID=2486356 RepID=A0A5S3P7G4_9SPHN|nr:DUF418 domain-containing protein [Qipengyuania marisflavi]
MGILVANIIVFGQPHSAGFYPGAFISDPGTGADAMWAAQLVLVDGKMRGLFTLLFGAGLLLFMDKAWARGATRWLQVRRLAWLGLFGALHYFLLWRGDILFLYAVAGLVALLVAALSRHKLLVLGALGYVVGGLLDAGSSIPFAFVADTDMGDRPIYAQLAADLDASKAADFADGMLETALITQGRYGEWVAHNVSEHASSFAYQLQDFWIETLPLMLLGMALYRYGLFSGGLAAGRQRLFGWILLAAGTALSVPVAVYTLAGGLTYYGTLAALTGWLVVPQLLSTLGLAALLGLWGMHANGWLAERIKAAGRAAFSNYLGTSAVMMIVFHGWAGGLFGQLSRGELYLVAAATCALMLLWSKLWLDRFRYGPLEWLWRCLTYGCRFPLRKSRPASA